MNFPAVVHKHVLPTATLPEVATAGHVRQFELEPPLHVAQLK